MKPSHASYPALIPEGTREDVHRYGFSPARFAASQLHISGQAGIGPQGEVPAAFRGQAALAFVNLGRILELAGLTFEDVCSLTSYHVGGVGAQLETFVEVKAGFFQDLFPVWTAVGVTDLADSRFKVELSAIAAREPQ